MSPASRQSKPHMPQKAGPGAANLAVYDASRRAAEDLISRGVQTCKPDCTLLVPKIYTDLGTRNRRRLKTRRVPRSDPHTGLSTRSMPIRAEIYVKIQMVGKSLSTPDIVPGVWA